MHMTLNGEFEKRKSHGRPRRRWEMYRVCGMDATSFGQGKATGCCEHGNEPLDFTECGEFLDHLPHLSRLSASEEGFRFVELMSANYSHYLQ
jgi:hypothetical protein